MSQFYKHLFLYKIVYLLNQFFVCQDIRFTNVVFEKYNKFFPIIIYLNPIGDSTFSQQSYVLFKKNKMPIENKYKNSK